MAYPAEVAEVERAESPSSAGLQEGNQTWPLQGGRAGSVWCKSGQRSWDERWGVLQMEEMTWATLRQKCRGLLLDKTKRK